LVAALDEASFPDPLPEKPVTGVNADTRRLQPGEIFVALPGNHVDGARFVRDAVRLGAAAIVTQSSDHVDSTVPLVRVSDARTALSRLAATYWNNPSRELRVVGITGTDGKTTTTFLTAAVLEGGGHSTGYVSTVDLKIGRRRLSNPDRTTTPQPPELHRRLREMVDAGNTHAVVESSSHGLRLSRLNDVAYDVAVMTNVTSEHLELHGTVEQYRLDKARLFTMLGRSYDKGVERVGVVNADDPSADLFLRATAGPTLTYGTYRHADVVAQDIRQTPEGIRFKVRHQQAREEVLLPLLGAYNVYNALAAACVGIWKGIPLPSVLRALEGFTGVPGRMQRIDVGQPFGVVVDYAHTADALEKALRTLRPATGGKLIVVFGSAGERDRAKRPALGAVAQAWADYTILTNEDPRGEDELAILREIAAGAEREGGLECRDFALVADRQEAIHAAFERSEAGDIVLLAGKGHETSIELADRSLPWSDADAARVALRSFS